MRKKLLVIPVLILVAGAAFQGAVPAAAGGGGCHGPVRDGRGVRADIVNFCFDPAMIRVAPGQTVTWTNRDQADHTVTGVGGSFGNYESIQPGASVTFKFSRDGLYPFFCMLHPGMVGVVVVGAGTGLGAAESSGVPAVTRAALAAPVSHPSPQPASGPGSYYWVLTALGVVVAAGAGYQLGRRRLSGLS
jgi:plastocyanin